MQLRKKYGELNTYKPLPQRAQVQSNSLNGAVTRMDNAASAVDNSGSSE
ncbi:hypothetical protein OH492_14935 [Vibrio chagasii]|nr:hypothetical protein [Vibrio chagasii]